MTTQAAAELATEFYRFQSARLCAVLGQPVSHSRSPRIHRLFAEQFGISLQYERIEVSRGTLREVLGALRSLHCTGVNVTVPLKEEAAALCARLTPAARVAGAANTLWWEQDELCGDNTDGVGLVADLEQNWQIPIRGRRVVVLGAGGAAAGVIPALLEAGLSEIAVHNRDPERATRLVARFLSLGHVVALREGSTDVADIVINATSAGLHGNAPEFPASLVGRETVCYDLSYAPEATPFLRRARELGARALRDGHGMLVEQAAAAFTRWHGVAPSTKPVLAALLAR